MPPQFDVVALADDLRLGMFVIARLATRHGIAVTLRSSPYGGTTAIVLIPHEIVVRDPLDEYPSTDAENAAADRSAAKEPAGAAAKGSPVPVPERQSHERSRESQPVARARTPEASGERVATGTSRGAAAATRTGAAPAGRGGIAPLPRRVPQTSLAAELREDVAPATSAESDGAFGDFTAERAASSLAGFQRGTLQARDNDTDTTYDQGEETAPEGASVTATPPADRS